MTGNSYRALLIAPFIAATAAPASALTINLLDDLYTVTATADGGVTASSITETVESTTFSFVALNNLVGAPRLLGFTDGDDPDSDGDTAGGGIQLGGAGGSTVSFSLSSDRDVVFTGYETFGEGFVLGDPRVSIVSSLHGALVSAMPLNPQGAYVLPSILMEAGEIWTFTVDSPGAATMGAISSFSFETAAAVPVPAAAPLLLGALGGLVLLRRGAR